MPDKRYWSTAEQREWLKQQLPAYIEARKNHRLPIYWPTLYALWFLKWPARKPIESDPTDSEREDEDAHIDIVEGAASDIETAPPVDAIPAVNTITPEPSTTLGKRKAEAKDSRKKKKVS